MSRLYFTDRNFVRTLPRVEALLDKFTTQATIIKVYRPTPADLARSAAAIGRAELRFPKV